MALPVLKVSARCSLVLSLIVALALSSPAHRVPCQPKFEGPPEAPVSRSLQSMASASGGDVPDHISEITLSPSPRFSEISRSPTPAFSECSDIQPSDNEAPPEQEKKNVKKPRAARARRERHKRARAKAKQEAKKAGKAAGKASKGEASIQKALTPTQQRRRRKINATIRESCQVYGFEVPRWAVQLPSLPNHLQPTDEMPFTRGASSSRG